MNKKMLALIAAEVLTVAAMRVVYIIRRDRLFMPRGSKVRHVKGKPVYRQPYIPENGLKDKWTEKDRKGIVPDTPDIPPGADT